MWHQHTGGEEVPGHQGGELALAWVPELVVESECHAREHLIWYRYGKPVEVAVPGLDEHLNVLPGPDLPLALLARETGFVAPEHLVAAAAVDKVDRVSLR